MLDLENWQEKKYQMDDGEPMRLLCIDAPGSYPFVALDHEGDVWRFDREGKGYFGVLVNAPPEPVTITRWVNLEKWESSNEYEANIYSCPEFAERDVCDNTVASVIPVTITFTPNGR